MANKQWIQEAISHEGMLRRHFKVKPGQNIDMGMMDKEMATLHAKTMEAGGKGLSSEEQSLYSAMMLAKRLRKMKKK